MEYQCGGERLKDINPLYFGTEKCAPGHSFRSIRDHALIHYIFRGRGRFEKNGAVYELSKGDMFLILPGELTCYTADRDDPWEYAWIIFDGDMLNILRSAAPPVMALHSDAFSDIIDRLKTRELSKLYLASKLFEIMSELIDENVPAEKNYPRLVKNYIKLRYMESISVEQIAKYINLDRRYLSRLFKQRYGKTIQEYIIETRMKKAAVFLRSGYTVSQAAALVGYGDAFSFSKIYKKHTGIPPSQEKLQ